MFEEEDLPRPRKVKMEEMSVAELQEYIVQMQAKIEQVKQLIKSKQAANEAASLFFKK